MRKRRWLIGLAVGAALGVLWQRARAGGGLNLWLKRMVIRGAQSARMVRGREHAGGVRLFYVLIAPVYDLAFLSLPGYRQSAGALIEQLAVGPEDVALDVGCGSGLLTLPLAERARRVAGLDLSQEMLGKLAAKAAGSGATIDLHQGTVLDLPFDDGEFTLATTSFMLLYLTPEEKQRALAEIHRVLALGGRLGCLSSLGEIADIFLTGEAWEKLLLDAGFSDIQIKESDDVFRLVTAKNDGHCVSAQYCGVLPALTE